MRMTIVGKNPRAGGSECILFGHIAQATKRFTPISLNVRGSAGKGEELTAHGQWEIRPMRPGPGLETAVALVGSRADGDYCRTSGRLVMVSHNWSGVLQINNVGRKYTVDLYSDVTRLVLLDAINEILIDVTRLADVRDGVLKLPAMTPDEMIAHVVADAAWFRFLGADADFKPSRMQRALELVRAHPGEPFKLRVLMALLPKLALGPSAGMSLAYGGAQPAEDRLRDEVRCLAAAVEGLALRATAQA